MNKSKFHGKNKGKTIPQHFYTQASSDNIKEILMIKKYFPQLSNKKVEEVYKTINNSSKPRLHINITTKEPSYKQIIVSIGNNNILTFMKSSGKHVANINHALKDVKSDNFVDFIHLDYWGLIVNSNKIASPSDLLVVKAYIKIWILWTLKIYKVHNYHNLNLTSRFSVFPILLKAQTLQSILALWKTIIKITHIFNNIQIASKLRVAKVFPKSDMAIIWIDI